MAKHTLRFWASSNRFSASVLREELFDTGGVLRALSDGLLSSPSFWDESSRAWSSFETSTFVFVVLDFFFFLAYLLMQSWTDYEWKTHFFTMPPSATPPFNLREPPGRMVYSDMSDGVQVTEFQSRAVSHPHQQLPVLVKNYNGRPIVTTSSNPIRASSYAYFHPCNYHINRTLCISMLEGDGPRGSTLYDTCPRLSLIRSLGTLHVCVRRNYHIWSQWKTWFSLNYTHPSSSLHL